MIAFGEEYRPYLEKRTGARLERDAVFIANTHPLGVAGFERWNGSDVEAHFAGERGFLTRSFLRTLARYVFDQLGCDRVSGRIPVSRRESLVTAGRIGFIPEGYIRRAHKGEDFVLVGLLKEDCRWL